ncbi:hypothetical protein HGRIS_014775 [Hohenbuehelia grisea]|uniref:Laccase n=1 Tax=Hohenbuehelia grisea TaxID=104357 RepID=A0ABR3IQN9_9AGAR
MEKLKRAETYGLSQILVVNNLTDDTMPRGTSIHWHGLFMNRTVYEDGAAWISQCPIAPGDSYPYRFNVGAQTGTYWYHSHITTQYCDGLRGPLIIYDDHDPLRHLYDVDNESTIITLSDWFQEPSPAAFQSVGVPRSVLVNGLGREFFGNSPLTVVKVATNTRYRFRLINAGCTATIEFAIDGHSLTVIEIDGIEVHPYPTNLLSLTPGQRVSVVVNANQTVGNYWIRAFALWEGISPIYDDSLAIFRYDGAPVVNPKTNRPQGAVLRSEEALVPYGIPAQKPVEADVKINLNFTFPVDFWTLGNTSFRVPPLPVLLQVLNGANPFVAEPNGTEITVRPTRESIFYLPRNKLIEVSIPGGAALGPHPFHLHGHSFQVVRSAGSKKYNYINPPIRDVVNTGEAGDNVTIRFRTDNPGPWYLHCHVDFHLEGGLAVLFLEEPSDIREHVKPSKEWQQLCPKWDALKTGRKYSKSVWPIRPE